MFIEETDTKSLPEWIRKSGEPENRQTLKEYGWKEGEYGGAKFAVSSKIIEVDTESGVRAKMKITAVDFREDKKVLSNVFIPCAGFPGLDKKIADGFAKADLSGLEDQLDFDMVRKASKEKGVVYIPEMIKLPKGEGEPSFMWEADAIISGIDKFNSSSGIEGNITKDVDKLSLSGYSNGAGEATALIVGICRENSNPDLEINARLYSLVGILPIENIAKTFSQEIWRLAMLEVARRYKNVTEVEYDTSDPVQTKRLLLEVAKLLKTREGFQKVVAEIKKSAEAQEGGNLQFGIDFAGKIFRDVKGLRTHLKKFSAEMELPLIDSRVNLDLVLPAFDKICQGSLRRVLSRFAERAAEPYDAQAMLDIFDAEMGHPLRIRSWIKQLLPNVGSLNGLVIGESLQDPLGTHTGPITASPRAYFEAIPEKIT